MKKARTVAVGKEAVDIMVLEYSCVDSSVLSTIGKHCKESCWKLAVGRGDAPVDIKLHVDKQVMKTPKIGVEWDGNKVFPASAASKEKLREDFTFSVPFRGIARGLTVKDHYEVRPEYDEAESWFPATLQEQKQDGLFSAIVRIPNRTDSGIKGSAIDKLIPAGKKQEVQTIFFPAVKPENIREAGGMKKPLSMHRRSLTLHVPMQDPMHCVLSLDGDERLTHCFARPTPPPSRDARDGACKLKPRILLKVSKERDRVTSDVSLETLAHFLMGDADDHASWKAVRSVSEQSSRWKKAWVLQIGPFAEHTIELEKRYRTSSVLTLTVDGDVLCETTADDIESRSGFWECKFRLEGDRHLDWEVNEEDVDGVTLESLDLVRETRHSCFSLEVSVPETAGDMREAQLTVDDRDFRELQESRPTASEKLDCDPMALRYTHGLDVPHKINEKAIRTYMARLKESVDNLRTKASGLPSGGGFFASCCSRPQVGSEEFVNPRRSRGSNA